MNQQSAISFDAYCEMLAPWMTTVRDNVDEWEYRIYRDAFISMWKDGRFETSHLSIEKIRQLNAIADKAIRHRRKKQRQQERLSQLRLPID